MYTAELTTAYKDAKRQPTTQSSPVSPTTQSEMTSNQPRGERGTNTEPEKLVLSLIIVNNDTTDGGHYIAVKMSAKRYLRSRGDRVRISK